MKMKLLQTNMTSNKSNGYEVTEVTPLLKISDGITGGFCLFDGNANAQEDYPCYHSTNFNGDKVVVLKLPSKLKIVKFVYYTRRYWYNINSVSIYGSNDNNSYTELTTVDASRWSSNNHYDINIDKPSNYLYYKIVINSNTYATCMEMQIYVKSSGYLINNDNKLICKSTQVENNKNNIQLLYDKDVTDYINELPIQKIKSNYNVLKII